MIPCLFDPAKNHENIVNTYSFYQVLNRVSSSTEPPQGKTSVKIQALRTTLLIWEYNPSYLFSRNEDRPIHILEFRIPV